MLYKKNKWRSSKIFPNIFHTTILSVSALHNSNILPIDCQKLGISAITSHLPRETVKKTRTRSIQIFSKDPTTLLLLWSSWAEVATTFKHFYTFFFSYNHFYVFIIIGRILAQQIATKHEQYLKLQNELNLYGFCTVQSFCLRSDLHQHA